MADVKVEFIFQTSLTQKEFSLMTRALAGHNFKEDEWDQAQALNQRLLKLRLSQLREYTQQSARALQVAEEEAQGGAV